MSCSGVSLNKDVANMFADLPQPTDSCLASYIWIGSDCRHCRYKTRTLEFVPRSLEDLPWWDMSDWIDAFLEPVAFFKDPFFPSGRNFLVLCETYTLDRKITGKLNVFEYFRLQTLIFLNGCFVLIKTQTTATNAKRP